ncbi:hypothetical protein ACHQM5_017597 [Ranunculus cassubicifolius]
MLPPLLKTVQEQTGMKSLMWPANLPAPKLSFTKLRWIGCGFVSSEAKGNPKACPIYLKNKKDLASDCQHLICKHCDGNL